MTDETDRRQGLIAESVEQLQQRQDEIIVALGSKGILPSEITGEIRKLHLASPPEPPACGECGECGGEEFIIVCAACERPECKAGTDPCMNLGETGTAAIPCPSCSAPACSTCSDCASTREEEE